MTVRCLGVSWQGSAEWSPHELHLLRCKWKSQPWVGQSQACLLRATLQNEAGHSYTAHCYFHLVLDTSTHREHSCSCTYILVALELLFPQLLTALSLPSEALPPTTECSHLPHTLRSDPQATSRILPLDATSSNRARIATLHLRQYGRETPWSGVSVCQFRPSS